MSIGFYVVLWAQIALGIGIYLFGFTEPRILLTLSALLNAAAMMMSFVFVYMLNRSALHVTLQPGKMRIAAMLVAFLFFAYFLVTTILSA